MSAKKKNPLKDLSAFLAHQEEASQITIPKSVVDHEAYLEKKPSQVTSVNRPEKVKISEEVSAENITAMLSQLKDKNPQTFRKILGEIVLETIDQLPNQQPADKMLINTILYLNNQKNWQSVVKSYWENKE